MIWHQGHFHFTAHMLLHVVHHGFHVPENRIEIHGFMHLLPVPSCYLVFPVELAFGQDMLFEKMVCLDYDQRSCGLECHTSLDTYDGVAHMDVTAYTERSRYVPDLPYHVHRRHLLTVH